MLSKLEPYNPEGFLKTDIGQEHLADSDDCLFMTPEGFDLVIPLFKFRVLLGFDQRIGDLDKKRFRITAGAGDPRFYFLVALVITGTAASSGDKMFG